MKGQIAFQFIAAISIVMVFFVVFYVGLLTQEVPNAAGRDQENLHDLGERIKREISLAHEMEDGYERTITLPEKINSKTYNITRENGYTIISDGSRDFSIITTPYTGNFQSGTNTIRKDGGVSVE